MFRLSLDGSSTKVNLGLDWTSGLEFDVDTETGAVFFLHWADTFRAQLLKLTVDAEAPTSIKCASRHPAAHVPHREIGRK